MKLLTSLSFAAAITLSMAACTKPAESAPTDPAVAPGESTPAPTATTPAAPQPAADAGGMTNTLSVTYECSVGGDLNVRYAGIADISTSTASLVLDGVELKLPRKGNVWEDGTYKLEGNPEMSLAKADVFVFQNAVEKVNGKEMPVNKIVKKGCTPQNATP